MRRARLSPSFRNTQMRRVEVRVPRIHAKAVLTGVRRAPGRSLLNLSSGGRPGAYPLRGRDGDDGIFDSILIYQCCWSLPTLSSVMLQYLLTFFPTAEIVLQQVDELGRRQRVTSKPRTFFYLGKTKLEIGNVPLTAKFCFNTGHNKTGRNKTPHRALGIIDPAEAGPKVSETPQRDQVDATKYSPGPELAARTLRCLFKIDHHRKLLFGEKLNREERPSATSCEPAGRRYIR